MQVGESHTKKEKTLLVFVVVYSLWAVECRRCVRGQCDRGLERELAVTESLHTRLLPPPSAEPQCSIMTYSPDATVSLPPRFISFFIFPIVSVLVQTETADKSSPGPRCTRVLSNPVTLC